MQSTNKGLAVLPTQLAPRILAPGAHVVNPAERRCATCKHWAVVPENPQLPVCARDTPKIVTTSIPQVDESGRVTGMQTQVNPQFPPVPPHWGCGQWEAKIERATTLPPGLKPLPVA